VSQLYIFILDTIPFVSFCFVPGSLRNIICTNFSNPCELVRDLSSGVEDLLCQPIQGAIMGPEEFAEGLSIGLKSMCSHLGRVSPSCFCLSG
jgi:hypothetical protein